MFQSAILRRQHGSSHYCGKTRLRRAFPLGKQQRLSESCALQGICPLGSADQRRVSGNIRTLLPQRRFWAYKHQVEPTDPAGRGASTSKRNRPYSLCYRRGRRILNSQARNNEDNLVSRRPCIALCSYSTVYSTVKPLEVEAEDSRAITSAASCSCEQRQVGRAHYGGRHIIYAH